MDLKDTLKQIFLRPEQRIQSVEDLFEDTEKPQELPAPKKFSFFRKKALKIPVEDQKLTVRQRVKRYNASMEGRHGIPEDARKRG